MVLIQFGCQNWMNQTPSRNLTESNLFQNISSISEDLYLKTEQNFNTSKVKLPFSNIRMPSNDEFSKNKIMELQEQLLKLRRQLSQKQCQFSKEKSNLLSRIQILTEQNLEIQHRQQSLVQLNHTLELALKTQEQTSNKVIQKEESQLKIRREDIEKRDKMIKDLKKTLEEQKIHIRKIEEEKYSILESKDKKINELMMKNNELCCQKGQQQNKIKSLLNSKHYNKQLVSAIEKALNIHIAEKDLSFQDIQAQSNCFDESPIPKKCHYFNKKAQRRSNGLDTSYSRFSSKSFVNDLNSNKYQNSQCEDDYEDEEPERLLCQICKKVYEEQQFIRHMPQCQQITSLHRKRQQLQRAIHDIDEQRASVSQRKWKTKGNEERKPLVPLISNDRSTSRLKGRNISYGENIPSNRQMKVAQMQPNQQYNQRYRSDNFY